MHYGHEVLMTTTGSLDGWTVDSYLGPISTHRVIGTGLLTDIFSSFSDFFGARSDSYRNKMEEIEHEALSLVQLKATRMGANAVIGLRVDHDEISGAGKSMLMVTVTGTAVKIRRKSVDADHSGLLTESGVVGITQVREYLRRQELMSAAQNPGFQMSEADWEFVLAHRIGEVAFHVIRETVRDMEGSSQEKQSRALDRFRAYFSQLDPPYARRHLYTAVVSEPILWKAISELVRDLNLMDYGKLAQIINSEGFRDAARALQLVGAGKDHYSDGDIADIETLLREIEVKFPVKVEFSRKSSVLSSKERSVWRCAGCGELNEDEHEVCRSCSRDHYGFMESSINPVRARRMLEDQRDALRELLRRTR